MTVSFAKIQDAVELLFGGSDFSPASFTLEPHVFDVLLHDTLLRDPTREPCDLSVWTAKGCVTLKRGPETTEYRLRRLERQVFAK